jgi:ADP-heptose:LPS heptosyltransferase
VSEGYLRHKLHIVPPNTKLVWYDHQWTDEQVRASGFRSDQEFVQYGDPDGRKRTGVVIHARARTLGADRNWPAERWHELGRRLVRAGVLVTWIGRSGQSVQPAAGEGYSSHDKSLRLLVPLLNDSIIVGSSSGPMHLATLCGCPQVVLTGECNRARYERHWNPLRTPVHIVPGGWQPSVDAVFESVMSLWSGSVALAG